MKKLDRLLILSYLGPFILTFCIALFVLDMMFLWTYVDDLIGKGVEGIILLELMFYASAVKVPLAFPIAVLVASIMTLGNFGEQFELTAVKAAGISLFRFLRPLILFTIFMSGFAFYFSNNILPVANLKFTSLLNDLREQKPALNFQEQIFNNDIENFSIRLERKSEDQKSIYEVLIYDHTENKGNNHLIMADSARFGFLNEGSIMTIKLFNGCQYKEETEPISKDAPQKLMTTKYKNWEKHFDLSAFKLERQDQGALSNLHRMLNLNQLLDGMDTVNAEIKDEQDIMLQNLYRYYIFMKRDNDTSGLFNVEIENLNFYNDFDTLKNSEQKAIIKNASVKIRNIKNIIISKQEIFKFKNKDIIQYKVYLHQKFTLSVACIVLFFIGAPLGAIIKKGGFGWPMLLAVIFFVIYIVLSTVGEKSAEQLVMTPIEGMWLSTFILLPIGAFLTWKAKNDSPIFSSDFYKKIFKFKKRNNERNV